MPPLRGQHRQALQASPRATILHSMEQLIHPIPPYVPKGSRILILGSFPSRKSRAAGFYYAHPQNRFWKLLAALFREEPPLGIEGRKELLDRHRIALWDVVQSCGITGSSDANIRNPVLNPVDALALQHGIHRIFLNGSLAGRLYLSDRAENPLLTCQVLPSTSAANAAYNLERLAAAWRAIL